VNLVTELAGIPLVCVAQGSDVHHYLDLPMRRRAILNLVKRARIITRSEDLRQRLLNAGAEAGRVSTVYNGVDLETFHPGDKAAARAELKLPIDGKILLFVGNFLPVKGLDLLIRSVAHASTTIAEPLHLVMIGSGPLQPELTNLARQSGLKDNQLFWAGRRAPAEVAQFMRAADAVCLTSHNEGVPNVLLEALASGRPLISTDVGGISEIINPSPQGGVLVKGRETASYAAALLKMVHTPPNAALLSNHAISFAWRRCAQTYLDFFLTKT
jgi:glycosyltransferase involved in cell wall biosynthesis